MGRLEAIARSIVFAIVRGAKKRTRSPIAVILTLVSTIFSFYQLPLHRHRPHVFGDLRQNHWKLSEDDYLSSFTAEDGGKPEDMLRTMGDMGFSGSSFFSTSDSKYLIKSVPRHHEHTFFRDDLLDNYAAHMASHPKSLLIRICEFLASSGLAIGHQLGLAPSHHIIMENVLYGRDTAAAADQKWEQWDLKPTSYFYPERDIAQGRLASEATKSRLADDFNDKIRLTQPQADELFAALEADTRLLAQCNVVDYSLFLVRIATTDQAAAARGDDDEGQEAAAAAAELVPRAPPAAPPDPPSWRTGVPSADGKYIYRAAVLDFFWAKHKTQPRVMTFLVNAYNKLITRHGPMSITTTPEEYRERFLKLCHDIVEVKQGVVSGESS